MRLDPHSYADLDQGRTEHVHLDWTIDIEAREIRGSATLVFQSEAQGPLDLDTRDLHIESVEDDQGPLGFTVDAADPILGSRLRIERSRPAKRITVTYRTGDASGLMWLSPDQTSGAHPFMLSQCQAIHARSLAPLQDTPRGRLTYSCRVALPDGLSAVMSAAPGAPDDDGRLRFEMPQPIPPYLLAIAVGELSSRDLGPRTRVWAEPAVLEQAAWEFADVERMLEAAEDLFGPYAWDRFDFVVLPASFPLGGMENPRMTFLTPTLLAGDRSLVGVLAHELAHSWTGNLVTNADNEHFWLNEGWTVYAERRIVEALYGKEAATQAGALARVQLDAVLAERQAEGRTTRLRYDQTGLDPDEEFSIVPYEKGFLLLVALENEVGRERFDAFTKAYIERFAFSTLDTDTFIAFVREELNPTLDLLAWIDREGLPAEVPAFRSERLFALRDQALGWKDGARPEPGGTCTEVLFFLSRLPDGLEQSDLDELDALFGLRATRNAELRSAWLHKVAQSGATCEDDAIRAFVTTIGRGKLLRPVLRGLVAAGRRDFATALLDGERQRLHGSVLGALDRIVRG